MTGTGSDPGASSLLRFRDLLTRRRAVFSFFDLLPWISVLMVLVMFQLVRSERGLRPGIRVTLPPGAFAEGAFAAAHRLTILPDGRMFIDDETVDTAGLPRRMEAIFRSAGRKDLLIEADVAVPSGTVSWTMDIARRSGASEIVLATGAHR